MEERPEYLTCVRVPCPVVQDIEREEIEFITKTLGCLPVAHIDSFTAEKLGSAELVEESSIGGADMKVIKLTGVPNPGKTVTVLARASNRLVSPCARLWLLLPFSRAALAVSARGCAGGCARGRRACIPLPSVRVCKDDTIQPILRDNLSGLLVGINFFNCNREQTRVMCCVHSCVCMLYFVRV